MRYLRNVGETYGLPQIKSAVKIGSISPAFDLRNWKIPALFVAMFGVLALVLGEVETASGALSASAIPAILKMPRTINNKIFTAEGVPIANPTNIRLSVTNQKVSGLLLVVSADQGTGLPIVTPTVNLVLTNPKTGQKVLANNVSLKYFFDRAKYLGQTADMTGADAQAYVFDIPIGALTLSESTLDISIAGITALVGVGTTSYSAELYTYYNEMVPHIRAHTKIQQLNFAVNSCLCAWLADEAQTLSAVTGVTELSVTKTVNGNVMLSDTDGEFFNALQNINTPANANTFSYLPLFMSTDDAPDSLGLNTQGTPSAGTIADVFYVFETVDFDTQVFESGMKSKVLDAERKMQSMAPDQLFVAQRLGIMPTQSTLNAVKKDIRGSNDPYVGNGRFRAPDGTLYYKNADGGYTVG